MGEKWVEIYLLGRWQKALISRVKEDGKIICITGFGLIAMSPKNVREIQED